MQQWICESCGFIYDPGLSRNKSAETTNPDGTKSFESYASMTYGGLMSLVHAGRSGDEKGFLELDIEFHALIMEMSGNEMFSRLNNLVSEVLIGRTHYGLMPKFPHDEALQLHVDVANAVQSGNADAAGAAMLRIMDRTMTEMGEIWEHGVTEQIAQVDDPVVQGTTGTDG